MSRNGFLSKLLRPQSLIVVAMIAVAVVALQIGPGTRTAQATDTAVLTPNGGGNYQDWDDGDESDIDETGTVDCGTDDGAENVRENSAGDRESVNIDLSSIPNGSVVTSVAVHVWGQDDLNSDGSNGTFQTFARVGGSNTDSGVDIVASSTCTETTQTINIADFVKVGTEDFEIGVVKDTTDDDAVWVGAIRVVVTYTAPAANPTIDTCGIDVALIIDTSSSVADAGSLPTTKTELIAFATDLLADTNSTIGVVEFDNGARTNSALSATLATVTAGINAATTGSQVPGGPAGGGSGQYTNWQAALIQAQTVLNAGSALKDNVAILVSDGDPTQSNDFGASPNTSQPNVHYAPAVSQANTMKGLGTTILSMAPGASGDSVLRLNGVSSVADTFTPATFATLGDALIAKFNQTCYGHLTLNKVVASGDAANTAWTLHADGPGTDTDLNGTTGVNGNVVAGAYALSETGGPAGYEASLWVCTKTLPQGGTTPVTVTNGSVTVAVGDNVTCTITNRHDNAVITVHKVIGTTATNGWVFTGSASSGDSVDATHTTGDDGTGAADFDVVIVGGSATITITETVQTGYVLAAASCVDDEAEPVGTPSVGTNSVSVDVSNADQVHCTFTNRVSNGTLTICKETDPEDTRTEFKFNLSWVDGDDNLTLEDGDCTPFGLAPGSYSVGEWVPDGWRLTDVSGEGCVYPVEDPGPNWMSVSLEAGESITCTFEDEQLAHLKLNKVVEGADVSPSLWTLIADGPGDSGLSGPDGVEDDLPAGSYTLSETGGPANFTASEWDCNDVEEEAEGVEESGGYVLVLEPGDDVECTITNTFVPPEGSITIAKLSDFGGSDIEFSFSDNIANCNIGPLQIGEDKTCAIEGGTYKVSETSGSGFTLNRIVCVGSGDWTIDEASASVQISLTDTENVMCSFYNDPPHEPGPTPQPPLTVVPTQQLSGVQATPTLVAVVESIRPPETGDAGDEGGVSGAGLGLLAGLIGLGSAVLLVIRWRKHQA